MTNSQLSCFSDAVKHFYRLALYLSLGQNTVPLRIQVWVSQILSSPRPHSLYLSFTFLFSSSLVTVSSSSTSTYLSLTNIVFFYITISSPLFIHVSPSLSLSLPLSPVCCITSLNSYGLLNYLHKLLLYRDLLNILPRPTRVQNLQCQCLPPLLYTGSKSYQPLRVLVFIIDILCDV